MGIASQWPAILWEEGGFVHRDKAPTGVKTVFVDGQIRLMQSFIHENATWREFVSYMFISYIRRLHATYDVVVLAFDNYTSVPLYKSIEQQRRSENNASFVFTTGQDLPGKPPKQEIWTSALMNRAFKTKVLPHKYTSVCNMYEKRIDTQAI